MIHSPERPYLSFVATARNDDHGSNLIRRLQTFVNALADQAKRHSLPVELVLVEWNPPPEKPPLAEALRWPDRNGLCQVRIVTVPPEIHRRFRYAETLPLYQMIAKNAGIRRAAGEYILATNIDILFSSELVRFFAERRLEPGRMYRINRHDVDADVPVDAPVEDQLAYCRTHVLRINTREGTFPVNADDRPAAPSIDIVSRHAGISFGAGWGAPEQYFGRLFRSAAGEIGISVQPAAAARTMLMDLEPAAAALEPLAIGVLDESGSELGQVKIGERSLLKIHVPAGAVRVRLHAGTGGSPMPGRTCRFRVLRCEWAKAASPAKPPISAEPAPRRPMARGWQLATSAAQFAADLFHGKGSGRIGLPLPRSIVARLRVEREQASFVLRPDPAITPTQSTPAPLHTNACGDFTLAHRRHWLELRGYPEFDLFSMNVDSVFCYTAHYGGAPEHILPDPMRIYHIEHATGSGWTPEGQELLYRRLVERRLPWLPNEQVLDWASQMERWKTTLIFNREDWGLSGFQLAETRPAAAEDV